MYVLHHSERVQDPVVWHVNGTTPVRYELRSSRRPPACGPGTEDLSSPSRIQPFGIAMVLMPTSVSRGGGIRSGWFLGPQNMNGAPKGAVRPCVLPPKQHVWQRSMTVTVLIRVRVLVDVVLRALPPAYPFIGGLARFITHDDPSGAIAAFHASWTPTEILSLRLLPRSPPMSLS